MPLIDDTILVNRYRIDGLLVQSDTGAVYRAFDSRLSMPVAVKERLLDSPEQIARFKQEAIKLERLQHAALCRVLNHFSEGGQQYLVMDFVEGRHLEEITSGGQQPLTGRRAADYIIQVCQAVSYLHGQNPPVIHRDIKPRNIKITAKDRAVLVDLGLVEPGPHSKETDRSGAGFSAPEYEQTGRATPAVDLYSLGATLYALLTGQRPPDGESLVAGRGKLDPPHQLNASLNRDLSQAVVEAMSLDPADRPPSVAAWQQRLEAIIESLPHATPRAGSAKTPKGELEVKTRPAGSKKRSDVDATYWLVDATGLGTPVGGTPLMIGRHPNADIVIDDASMSRHHAEVRVEGHRCLVQDKGSANGTYLNGQRLGAEWYPFNPGDILTLGSARYHLTITRPVRVANAEPKPAPVLELQGAPPPGQTDELVTPESPPASVRGVWRLAALIIIVGLVGLGVLYWPVISQNLQPITDSMPVGDFIAGRSAEATGQSAEPSQVEAGVTRQAQPATETAQTGLDLTATATAQVTTFAILTGTVTAPENTPTATPRVPTDTPTVPPTPFPLTPTATATPVRVIPAAAGPTAIPIESNEIIDRIGVLEVIDVDINERNPNEVYAVVKKDGIYKSINGGDGPWVKLPVDATGVVALVIDPTDPTRLYAPTWNAVLKSTDGGNSWEAKTNGLVSNRAVDVLTVDARNPNRLYAGVGEKLVVSTDGGETWTSLGYGEGLGLGRFFVIVIDPFNSDIVYVGGLAAAIFKSTDAGKSFVSAPVNTGQGAYGLAAHPTQRDVYLAGINSSEAAVIKTENAWEFRSVSSGLIYGGADSAYSAITYAPSNPNIVYVGTGYEENRYAKGIFKSVDGGEQWTIINNGLSLNPDYGLPYYVKAIAVHPDDPALLFAATGGGLFKSVDGGGKWNLR